jgi:hypothetical protein
VGRRGPLDIRKRKMNWLLYKNNIATNERKYWVNRQSNKAGVFGIVSYTGGTGHYMKNSEWTDDKSPCDLRFQKCQGWLIRFIKY